MSNFRTAAGIRSIAETGTQRGLGRSLAQATSISEVWQAGAGLIAESATERENTAMNHNNDNTGSESFRAEDRIRIVLKGLSGRAPIDELCRREGISQRLYCQWALAFLEAGKNGLRETPRAAREVSGEIWSMAC